MASSDTPILCKTERLDAGPGASPDHAAQAIARAAQLLQSAGLVAFPTETVYGLAADALDPAAVERIFRAKGRPHWDPLIVHIADAAMLARIAHIPPELQPRIDALVATHWPGPLTLLLPRTAAIPDAVTAGRPLVGVRMPAHPIALALLRAAGLPLAAPSANRFGHTSPTTAAHVLDDLDGRIDAVLDGGASSVGVESTVLDPTQTPMVVYRPGAITPAMLTAATGQSVTVYIAPALAAQPESLPSPGVGIRHYAPRARLLLVRAPSDNPDGAEAVLAAALAGTPAGETVGVLLPDGWQAPEASVVYSWGSWQDHSLLARRLFAGLRELDSRGVGVILCPVPQGDDVAAALRDRLEKAARPKE